MNLERINCPKCSAEIKISDIEYSNGCNEEGEDYGVVHHWCDCGEDTEFSQWGEFENTQEAIDFFIEKLKE